jgi:hypothetical protein
MNRRFALCTLAAAAGAALAVGSSGCAGDNETTPADPPADTTAPAAWATIAVQAIRNDAAANPPGLPPVVDSRLLAMAFVAMHDVLNAIDRRYRPYLSDARSPGADPGAAVASAVYTVLKAQLPSQSAYLDDQYARALAALSDGAGKSAGVDIGGSIASAVLAARAADGSAQANDPPYTLQAAPGVYQPTPPIGVALLTGWGAVKPFVMASGAQFRVPPDYAVTDAAYTADFNEIKTLGGADSTLRTAEQSQIAKFWLENTTQSWALIALKLAAARQMNGWDLAQLLALLELAQADAAIASLESKYHYNFWRPITAVRAADDDGNPDTAGDPAWTPFDPVTPPIPDYPSNHAGSAGAGRAVLQALLGGDAIDLDYASSSLPGVTRHFSSLSQIEQEIGLSRIYVGYHFRNAVVQGLAQGEQVGAFVVAQALGAAGDSGRAP